MPTNDFLPFATDPAANVITQGAFDALPARVSGFVAGTAQSAQLNKAWRQSSVMAAVLGQFINDFGGLDALDDGNIGNLVRDFTRSLQRGTFSLGVATGTANAWVLTPVPSVAAYAAGRPMMITIPATNSSATVNANVSGLGNRRVKKADGTDPAIGDLVAGRMIWTADDGSNIRVLSPLASDRLATPYLGFRGDPVLISIPSGTQTLISSYTAITNNLPASSQSGGVVTIGASGFYQVTANLGSLLADFAGNNYGAAISVSKVNGSNAPILSVAGAAIEIIASNVPSTRAISASGIAKLASGDRIAVFFQQTKGTAQNVSISFDIEFRGA